eukprot:g8202.t1
MQQLEVHFTKSGQKDQESKKEPTTGPVPRVGPFRPREKQEIPAHLLDEALLADDDAEPPLAVEDIISRFRQMGQPIILFGETDMQRRAKPIDPCDAAVGFERFEDVWI